MKCISCGNLIPDASTVCPFCNNAVSQTPVNPVIPETPTQPVLPQDQGMSVPAQVAPMPEVAPVGQVQAPQTPVMPAAPVNPVAAPIGMAQAQPQVFEPTAAPTTDMVAPTPEVPAPVMGVTPPSGPAVVSNQGEIIDGAKVGTTATKEKKNPVKIIIIVLLVLLVLGGVGGGLFYYFSQYKTGEKRIGEVINGLFKSSLAIKNENIELASGKYSIEGSIEVEEEKIAGKLDGKYAMDLPNGIIDYTFNIKSLEVGEELLDAGPVNLELYVADSNVYLLLQNFYSKYIYTEVEGMDEIFDSIQQNDINYQTIVIGVRDALKAALNASSYVQTVEDIIVNGKNSKANVIRIKLDKKVGESMSKAFLNSLGNNQTFISELAKISGEEEATIKDQLLNPEKNEEDAEEEEIQIDATLEIYTAMFGNNLVGMKLEGKNDDQKIRLEVYPIANGYGFVGYDNDKKMLEVTSATTNKVTSSTREKTNDILATLYDEESGAIKVALKTVLVEDINPKVEKVNVKDSINANYLTQKDLLNIYDKAKAHGNLGVLLQSVLGTTMEEIRSQVNAPLQPTTPTNPSSTVNPSAGTIVPII